MWFGRKKTSQRSRTSRGGAEQVATKTPIVTRVPGHDDIELSHYYDQFITYYENCELETKRWFVEHARPDWIVLDCGANIGYYSILFARLCSRGRVYAFEPTTTVEMLRGNLKHARVEERVEVVPKALGANAGHIEDNVYRIWGGPPDRATYDFTTVDAFVSDRGLVVDAIKIDVDSFDFEVLRGAEQTLRDQDPFVMVELNHALSLRQQSVPHALEFMARIGYRDCETYDYENFLFKRSGYERAPAAQIVVRFGERQKCAPAR
jgi:FkbM family methyltransferase